MADEKRDWIDIIAKLLIPVVIAIGGILYSAHQAKVESERLALERDIGYVKMLASTNENEKKLGMGIIGIFSRQHKFSPELVAVLTVFAGGPEDDLTKAANRILTNAGIQQQAGGAKTANAAADSAVTVYIQIAKEEQRADALVLQDTLRKDGFTTPGIELATGEVATVHTYIRFFAASGALKASRVKDVMSKLGYTSSVQDFSAYTPSPLSSIEVWIGKSQGNLPTTPGN